MTDDSRRERGSGTHKYLTSIAETSFTRFLLKDLQDDFRNRNLLKEVSLCAFFLF